MAARGFWLATGAFCDVTGGPYDKIKYRFIKFWLTFTKLCGRLNAMKTDDSLLRAALIGYQNELARIEQAMAEIKRQLGSGAGSSDAGPAKMPKRRLSAAARKRIAAAQKKRWAEYKKQKAAQQKS